MTTAPNVTDLHLDDLDVKAGDGYFSGTASTTDPDMHGDIVMPGAFDPINVAQVVMLFSHRSDEPRGGWRDIRQDGSKLRVRGQRNLKVKRAEDIHALLRRGDVSSLSIGFTIADGGATIDQRKMVRQITKGELWEISLVAMPANRAARVDQIKSGVANDLAQNLMSEGFSKADAQEMVAKSLVDDFDTLPDPDARNARLRRIAAKLKSCVRAFEKTNRAFAAASARQR